MNRQLMIIGMALSLVFTVAACNKNDHEEEQGLSVQLSLPEGYADAIHTVQVWVFGSDNRLLKEYTFSSARELAAETIPLADGDYTLVAGTNLTAPFSYTTYEGMAKEELLVTLTDGNASPQHAHYALAQVSVTGLTHADLTLTRVLAELQFTISGVPDEVKEVKAAVNNVATGFYPALSRLAAETTTVDLGTVTPENGIIFFPTKRMMPSVDAGTVNRATTASVVTLLHFTFTYEDGTTVELNAEAPTLENGGSYTPEVTFEDFRPDVTLHITDINHWVNGENVKGEILNPDK